MLCFKSRIKETLLDQVWRLTTLLLVVPATSATAERSFSALRQLKEHTCALGRASRDSKACWYCSCTAITTEPTSWTRRSFPRNLSVHVTNVLFFLEITWT